MSVKKLRHERNLSQEMLAETVGLSLRTIQRAECGDNIATSSWAALADYFGVEVGALKAVHTESDFASSLIAPAHNMAEHRAIQLIIFGVTFLVSVTQWGAYYAYFNPPSGTTSLSTILSVISLIALGASVFIYLFNHATTLFVWSYYLVTAAFVLCAIGIGVWAKPYVGTPSYALLFPAFYTLMLCALLVFHVLQTALSLKEEAFIGSKQNLSLGQKINTS